MNKILFITTNMPFGSPYTKLNSYRNGILAGVKFCLSRFDKLIIKIHPGESLKYYKFLLKDYHSITIYQNEVSLYKLFVDFDVVISFESTAFIEAFNLGKECFLIKTFNNNLPYPFNNENLLEVERPIYKLNTCNYFQKGERLIDIFKKIIKV